MEKLRNLQRKEYYIVLLVVAVAVIIGSAIASSRSQLEVIYPEKETVLSPQDFVIDTDLGTLYIGNSTWNEVKNIFPQGKILGMSTIYRPENLECLLTFSEDENILQKMHIDTKTISTSRGIRLEDPFARVIEAYGENCAYVRLQGETSNFDAVYGNDDNIVFQVRNGKVKRIILQKQ
ncbi:MAG: hypothetical protein H5T98_05215 [Syntrophomonadaceae bacterium]|nr:hypothetical protein [Syntrophomonadaceae bacterium]